MRIMTTRQDAGMSASDASGDALAPTSVMLCDLLLQSQGDPLTVAGLFGTMGKRSFGIVLLLLGMLASLPGASVPAGILIAVLACQMMVGRPIPVLPRFVRKATIPKDRLNWLLRHVVPVLRLLERVIRPRWRTPAVLTEQIVGTVVLLISFLLFVPIPLSNAVPALIIVLLSFAHLERDGVALCIAILIAAAALVGAAAVGWEGLLAAGWIREALRIY
jgi:hypothetical protein